ncbi:UvrD-helicase domain-containing protein [Uliginosibacterium sediminicola]|uniref:DNA 3'-5' helicase n=1 Tax=Uliginosibacterium sediminicola TaxID=2024550 RepID=A0ABU9Z0I8_9RHOO
MTPEHRQQQRFLALHPAHSVAVEACAGSGKTWLLSSRLLRLLLAGVKPGEILAITYTRKAAREIEARLRALLSELANLPDAQALAMLTERGLSADQARALPRGRSLFEALLQAEPGVTITTFHGWFARLLSGAPLESGLAGRSLDEAAGSLLDEAWAALAAECARAPAAEVAQALLWLYAELGAHSTKKLLKAFVERRAEWRVWLGEQGGFEGVLAELAAQFGVGQDPLARFFSAAREQEIAEFAQRLPGSSKAGGEMADKLIAALALPEREARFAALRSALLTKADEPRALKPVKAYQAAQGEAGVDFLLRRFGELTGALLDALGALQDQRNALFNQQALRVGQALLGKLEELKRARRVMDFSDLEAEIDALLTQEGTAAWLQARLDARYKHILLDEFQDTNPLQWRILRGWLDGYAGAGLTRPSVFLVGDPKQSIYRFRRAEPKLFTAAAEYFEQEFGALRVGNAHTFRNAQGIVDLVNAVFAEMPGFVPQTAERSDVAAWPTRVEVLPLIAGAAKEDAVQDESPSMRHPLSTPRIDAEDLRRSQEAELVATRIKQIVAQWQVRGRHGERPARYADVLILTRRKTQLASYEAALRAAGIPFVSPGQGGLLATLEAQDLLAVLRFLADPADNIMLAHCLRTPAFNLSNEELLRISARPGAWWPQLQALGEDESQVALQRAARLLSGWLASAAHLPAHDLIDRIFHESDWFARTRAALPEALWPGVHANLEALLELSLNVDAGRYPSLTRFVDELRRLSSSDEEAPDEGLVASAGEGASDGGRVRIMTIHGAKGLEAPIVWLIDANSPPKSGEGYGVAMQWPVEQNAPQHFSLLGRLGEAGPSRRDLLEAEKAAAEREELNLLYVAITRAEQVLMVSGIEPSRTQNAPTAWKRIDAALRSLGAESGVLGSLPAQTVLSADAAAAASPLAAAARPRSALRIGQLRRAPPAAQQESAAGLEFGSALHAWLEARLSAWPVPEVSEAVRAAGEAMLARPALRRFFDPQQYLRARNESDVLHPDGRLGRIDRWVEFADEAWVLDYKSGTAQTALLEQYRSQVQDYCIALQHLIPAKTVRGLLVFADGTNIEVE